MTESEEFKSSDAPVKERLDKLLIKAIENNIDKFEFDEKIDKQLVYKDLLITYKQKKTHTSFGEKDCLEITFKYKSLEHSYYKYSIDPTDLLERVIKSVKARQEKQYFEELSELCKF